MPIVDDAMYILMYCNTHGQSVVIRRDSRCEIYSV